MPLSRDAILGADDIVTEPVEVPEWAGKVLVRGLTGADRDAFEASIRRFRGGQVEVVQENARAKLVVRCLVDENGERLFADRDASLLGKKSAAVLDRLYDVAARLSGLSEEAREELEGNSDAATSGASASSSPESSDAPSLSY